MCLANFGLIYSHTEANENSQTPVPGPGTVSRGVQSDVMAHTLSILLQNFPFFRFIFLSKSFSKASLQQLGSLLRPPPDWARTATACNLK